MGILSWLKGGDSTPDKVADALINTGDALFFTSQEKSEFDARRQQQWLDLQRILADESSPRSVNRRVVAWSVIFMSMALTFACPTFKYFGLDDLAQYTTETAVAFNWPWAFVAVIVFYFGTHVLGALRK